MAIKAKSNSKTFWKYVSSKTKLRSNIPNLYKDDENVIKNDTEKANTLGGFFAKVQKPKFKLDFKIKEDIIPRGYHR